jgi:hypothetical protein
MTLTGNPLAGSVELASTISYALFMSATLGRNRFWEIVGNT